MSSFRNSQRKPYSRPAPRGDVDGQWLHDKAPTGPRGRTNLGRGAAPTPTGPAAANSKIVVSNLHYEITPQNLTSVFGQIGTLVREPLLRYDKSGRSTGSAIIAFETAAEATRAKKQFQGYLAKGQPMSIAYDTALPPRGPRRATSAPTTASLLNRIEKPPLAQRLTGTADDSKIPSAPRAFTGGPVRTARGGRGAVSSSSGAARAPPRGPKKPKTAEDLDKELDAYVGEGDAEMAAPVASTSASISAAAAVAPETSVPAQDVDMA